MGARSDTGRVSRKKGVWAERLACLFLRLKGYEIIDRNFKQNNGIGACEIDIIARSANTLCFMEVKYRSSRDGAFYVITEDAKRRIARAAQNYIAFNSKYATFDIRFDALLMNGLSFPLHIKNAWAAA